MGGDVLRDDIPKLPKDFRNASAAFEELVDRADRENASEAVKALTEIVLETENYLLAESCRTTIALLLKEYAPSQQETT